MLRITALLHLRDDVIGDFTGGAEKRPRKLKGREAIAEERFRELVPWYTLQGMDEATAREGAWDQMRDDTLKD
jgi:hypothetical protein